MDRIYTFLNNTSITGLTNGTFFEFPAHVILYAITVHGCIRGIIQCCSEEPTYVLPPDGTLLTDIANDTVTLGSRLTYSFSQGFLSYLMVQHGIVSIPAYVLYKKTIGKQ